MTRREGSTHDDLARAKDRCAAVEAIRTGDNQYTFPFGAPAFRAAFVEYMAREVGVAVAPGSSFYMDETQGTKRARFNFAKDTGTLEEEARRLQQLRRAQA